jgi:hypothetical protein
VRPVRQGLHLQAMSGGGAGMKRREATLLPLLPVIPGISSKRLQRDMERIQREFNDQMDAERRFERARRANDPHRCHCPFCYVIG